MTAKACFIFLIWYAMVVCTLTATCPTVSHLIGFQINSFAGDWYLQAQYISHTGMKEQLYCHKAQVSIKNNEMVMNSNIHTLCRDASFVQELKFTPKSTGEMQLTQNGVRGKQLCYFVSAYGPEHMLIYCCSDCGAEICESLFFFTRKISMDIDVMDGMHRSAYELQGMVSKVEYLSGDYCYHSNGTLV